MDELSEIQQKPIVSDLTLSTRVPDAMATSPFPFNSVLKNVHQYCTENPSTFIGKNYDLAMTRWFMRKARASMKDRDPNVLTLFWSFDEKLANLWAYITKGKNQGDRDFRLSEFDVTLCQAI